MTPNPFPPGTRPGLETKIAAAGDDADQILRTLDIELALRRAGRKVKGPGQVQTMRLLSVGLLFVLLLAGLGAMFYLRMQAGNRRPAPAFNAATASPAPGPSTQTVAPNRQSAPPTR